MKKNVNKQAFTLVEIIVAFSVLVLVIVASTNLLVSIIRSNAENVNTLVAYGLAQEGLEAVRNVRDSNWLLGADFQGKVGEDCLWPDTCLPKSPGDKKDFIIDVHKVESLGDANADIHTISGYAPWKITEVPAIAGEPDIEKTRLCMTSPDDSTGSLDVWYYTCSDASTDTKSLFSRYVEVDPMVYGQGTETKKYRVSSVVKWMEVGRPKEVRLTTELTDWKGGPL